MKIPITDFYNDSVIVEYLGKRKEHCFFLTFQREEQDEDEADMVLTFDFEGWKKLKQAIEDVEQKALAETGQLY